MRVRNYVHLGSWEECQMIDIGRIKLKTERFDLTLDLVHKLKKLTEYRFLADNEEA